MRDKMAISAYAFEKSRKGPIFKAGRFQSSPVFSTNKQYVKIKLMQNETNRWSIFLSKMRQIVEVFFGKDEILVKL